MTCINCQTRIASALNNRSGITEVSVSYETGTAEFSYDPEMVSLDQIITMIGDLGYEASAQNTSKKKVILKAVREIMIIVVLFFLLQRCGILNRLVPNSLADSEMGYGMLFVIGLITSVHCIAMCGGINLSQTLQKDTSTEISKVMFRNTLEYNIGRVVSYTVIGGVLGAVGALAGIGSSLQTSTLFQGILKLFAGIIMVVMGVNMLGIFPGLRRLAVHIPNFNKKTKQKSGKKPRTPFFIGLCNGLMPCLAAVHAGCCPGIWKSAGGSFVHALFQPGNCSTDAWIRFRSIHAWKTIHKAGSESRRNSGSGHGPLYDGAGRYIIRSEQ